ncbi:hypothetical protein [Spirosoma aerophilum]
MKTIYEWLLHNIGNEANFYTILNCQRSEASELDEYIRVMARTKEFKVLNMVLGGQSKVDSLENISGLSSGEAHSQPVELADEQAVIHYLATGEVKNGSAGNTASGIRLWVVEPGGAAGEVSFPPAQDA